MEWNNDINVLIAYARIEELLRTQILSLNEIRQIDDQTVQLGQTAEPADMLIAILPLLEKNEKAFSWLIEETKQVHTERLAIENRLKRWADQMNISSEAFQQAVNMVLSSTHNSSERVVITNKKGTWSLKLKNITMDPKEGANLLIGLTNIGIGIASAEISYTLVSLGILLGVFTIIGNVTEKLSVPEAHALHGMCLVTNKKNIARISGILHKTNELRELDRLPPLSKGEILVALNGLRQKQIVSHSSLNDSEWILTERVIVSRENDRD